MKKPDPLRDLQAIRQLVDRVFQDRLKGSESTDLEQLHPPVDLWETDEEIVLQAELPGLEAADVTVEAKGKTLTIRGERKAGTAPGVANVKTVHRLERESGSFNRTFTLSKSVDRFDVETSSEDGIFQVRLLKSGAKNRKKQG